jgi:FMN reductase
MTEARPVRIIGIGGTTTPASSTECALRLALRAVEVEGAEVTAFYGASLAELPHYAPDAVDRSPQAQRLVAALRAADGVVIASPGYHGTISGLVKNAIDYAEETARDERVYLDGLPVGLIVTAYGWQAAGSTLTAMRGMVHALRGWPTPLGAAVRTTSGMFTEQSCSDAGFAAQLKTVALQVLAFARSHRKALAARD